MFEYILTGKPETSTRTVVVDQKYSIGRDRHSARGSFIDSLLAKEKEPYLKVLRNIDLLQNMRNDDIKADYEKKLEAVRAENFYMEQEE